MPIEFISPEKAGLMQKMLKKPCPQGEIALDNQGIHVGFRNNLQFVLAMRKYGEDNTEAAQKWLFEHSADFGRAFNEMIDPQKGDPLFFDGYATIGDLPEEKWQKLEDEIYKVNAEQAA